jgi:hypothetical protein
MIAAVWAPGLVQLVVLQTWSLPTTFLPGRTTKRLIPVLAAVATFGAAAGGGLTQVVGAVLETEDLLLLSAALLGALGLFVPGVVRGLRALAPPSRNVKGRRAVPSLRSSMLDVIHSPLLSRLALVVFVTQFVSVLVDYQFSGELKARYDKEQLGSFLGTFYWVGNLLVLGVSLLATQRLVRWLGLGLCISGVAMLVGAGSAAYLAGALTAAFPAFYALVATVDGRARGAVRPVAQRRADAARAPRLAGRRARPDAHRRRGLSRRLAGGLGGVGLRRGGAPLGPGRAGDSRVCSGHRRGADHRAALSQSTVRRPRHGPPAGGRRGGARSAGRLGGAGDRPRAGLGRRRRDRPRPGVGAGAGRGAGSLPRRGAGGAGHRARLPRRPGDARGAERAPLPRPRRAAAGAAEPRVRAARRAGGPGPHGDARRERGHRRPARPHGRHRVDAGPRDCAAALAGSRARARVAKRRHGVAVAPGESRPAHTPRPGEAPGPGRRGLEPAAAPARAGGPPHARRDHRGAVAVRRAPRARSGRRTRRGHPQRDGPGGPDPRRAPACASPRPATC